MPKLMLAAALAAATTLCALDAQAADHHASDRVFYSDLDLSTPKGARAMVKRIAQTARELCARHDTPVIIPPPSEDKAAACQADAVARAVARLNAPMVTAEYDRIRLQQSRMAAAN